jgi:nicotinamide mononucleotide (NMN) deamidase PncC
VYLGNRLVCTITGAPYSCRITVSGADVGGQSLRLVITDARGASAEVSRSIVVAKFRAKMKLSVKTKALRHSLARRTISGRVTLPAGVSRRQGCNGTVTLVIKRAGHSVLNQQVRVSKACKFSRSLTTKRARQSFTAKARFGGNAVLASVGGTRRFS